MNLPGFNEHRAWLQLRAETPIFWALMMEEACPRCDHSPLTPVIDHPTHHDDFNDLILRDWNKPKLIGVVGLANPTPVYR